MYFKILLSYVLGYVNIEVEGYFIERFINICNSKKIFLWNMKRKHSTIIRVNIGIRDFKRIKKIAKKRKAPHDWCYIYNFDNPNEPIAVDLPAIIIMPSSVNPLVAPPPIH